MPNPHVIGQRVYLAAIDGSEEQVAANARWINDPEVTADITSGRYPMSLGAERAWIAAQNSGPTQVNFGIFLREGDRYIGNCGFLRVDHVARQAELGIMIGEKALWGHGHGGEAVGLLLDYGFGKLSLHRIELKVFSENERAIRCYRRLGFIAEGRLRDYRFRGDTGRYGDALLFSVLAPEWRARQQQAEAAVGPAQD